MINKKRLKGGAFFNTTFFKNLKNNFNYKIDKYKIKNITGDNGKFFIFYNNTTSHLKKQKIEVEINLMLCYLINKIYNISDDNIDYKRYLNNFIDIINIINNNNFKLFKYSIENFQYNKNNFLNIFMNCPIEIRKLYFKKNC